MGGAGDRPAAHGHRVDAPCVVADRRRGDLRFGRCTRADDPHHHVAHLDRLDRPGAVWCCERRPRDQALVAVADDADVAVIRRQRDDDLVLHLVGVLVLVDEHVAEAALVVAEHVGVLAEQLHRVEQQIIEVHRARLQQAGLVLGEHLGDPLLEDHLGTVGVRPGVEPVVLGRRDAGVDGAGREPLGVEVEVAQHVAHQPHRIGLVVDRERRREAQLVGVATQDPHARRVERRDPHLLGDRPDKGGDPLLHLGRGLVGEGDGEDLERRHALGTDQVGDAGRQNPGLAGPGARDDEQWPRLVRDRVVLGRVEPGEDLLALGVVGRHRLAHVLSGRRSASGSLVVERVWGRLGGVTRLVGGAGRLVLGWVRVEQRHVGPIVPARCDGPATANGRRASTGRPVRSRP